jgi:hypothetical protein
VGDLPAAHFVEAGDLVEEARHLGATVLGEQLHQRLGEFGSGDRQLLERALDRRDNVEAAIREYLQWEIDLVNAVGSDPDFGFRRFA